MATKTTVNNNAAPADLAKLGFVQESDEIVYRMLVGSEGEDKTGKSNFWLTAPGPIAGINLDIGLEGVARKFSKNKKIWVVSYNIPPVKDGKFLDKVAYGMYFQKTRDAYMAALSHKDVRTVVVDTGSDWWELGKLAEFGTLNPAVDIKKAYGPINSLFRSLIRSAYDTDKNLIITHKHKEQWEKNAAGVDAPSGKMKKTGFGEDNYLIQVNIIHKFEDGKFKVIIKNCRQNMSLAGFELEGDECTFQDLAVTVFDETSKEDWA